MFKVIVRSIVLLSICAFINNTLSITLVTHPLNSLLVPINEEAIRLISVLQGPPLNIAYTLIFATYEYVGYLSIIRNKFGFIPVELVVARTICIILHMSFLLCQLYGWKLYIETNEKAFLRLGFVIAVFLHYIWNTEGIYIFY